VLQEGTLNTNIIKGQTLDPEKITRIKKEEHSSEAF